MADDNFFNRSINDAAGATQSVDVAATSPVAITDGSVIVVAAAAAPAILDFTLPLAIVGGTVTIVNPSAFVMTAVPGAGDNAVAGTGGGAVAAGEAATFVSDGVLTWTRIT